MIRRLLALAALVGLAWFFRRLARASAGGVGRPGPGASRDQGPVRDDMVRDRVCNTFLPRGRAIRVTVSDQEHFFCSERCRQSFLAGASR